MEEIVKVVNEFCSTYDASHSAITVKELLSDYLENNEPTAQDTNRITTALNLMEFLIKLDKLHA